MTQEQGLDGQQDPQQEGQLDSQLEDSADSQQTVLESDEGEVQPFQCSQCRQTFSALNELRTHTQRTYPKPASPSSRSSSAKTQSSAKSEDVETEIRRVSDAVQWAPLTQRLYQSLKRAVPDVKQAGLINNICEIF